MANFEYDMNFSAVTTVRRRGKTRLLFVIMILLVITSAVVAYFVGYYVRINTIQPAEDNNQEYHKRYQDSVDNKKLEDNLRDFSESPHVAGSKKQLELAQRISELWKSYGFDEVEMPEYSVLLSRPQQDKPNTVSLIEDGKVVHKIVGKINVTSDPSGGKVFQYVPFLAYASNGTAEGELVYANLGTERDFKLLQARNISIKGKIVIFRNIHGRVNDAAKLGAKGALLYPDPIEHSSEGQSEEDTYPNTVWSSPEAIFEKPLRYMYGDPLTPDLPSIPGMYRRPLNKTGLPSIPSQPISYKDAMYLLSRLNGSEVPEEWRGTLNLTYRFGPGFKTTNTTVRIQVYNKVERMSIYNAIGTIRGREEPDRIVFIGNHRDGFFFGAVDPSSGTATLMEMSRVFGKLLKAGWRPRRTIKFCSWAAEEFGLVGSVEFVQQNSKLLSDRAVAYLNTDVAVGGKFVLVTQTCPLLTDFIFSWAKKIRDPNAHGDKTSMYDIMVERLPSKKNPSEPEAVNFEYMSDYYPFYKTIGVSSADFSYFFGHKKKMRLYPVYHTQEDTFYWVKKFVDPEFKFHEAMAKFQGGMLLDLADSPILPFGLTRLANALKATMESASYKKYLENNLRTDHIVRAIYKFGNASAKFVEAKEKLTGREDPLVLRRFNDQMMEVERAFIRLTKYPYKNPINNHVLNGDMYIGAFFTFISGKGKNLGDVEKQLSIVAMAISSAADIITPLPSSCQGLYPFVMVHFSCFMLLFFHVQL
ncbi:aminopeptidase NAALADL1-like isoform X2 [Actinia tenebrosa]|uniref:glutamate carboxypeptidase II n=1 Tax=Actinia tenebrosa TaxID=6105 RepID=A0A6P8IPS4_ACTTE|nr:aminopeptidase NAALADL1-like isoform X2 [Actinia tenebrosa]